MEAAGEYPADINMGLTEILLIILGILAFVGSFVIPENMENNNFQEIKIPEEVLKELVQNEVKAAAFQIEEKTEETVLAATEKTERYMERLSNEKIMAIQEYSDTVLGQINRNHEEAVFLYDMLNNKHTQVKNTVAELNNKMQDVKANIEQNMYEQRIELHTESVLNESDIKNESIEENLTEENTLDFADETGMQEEHEIKAEAGNQKNIILKLHEEGISMIEIAKTLGLGIGEVKLIIGLYESGE